MWWCAWVWSSPRCWRRKSAEVLTGMHSWQEEMQGGWPAWPSTYQSPFTGWWPWASYLTLLHLRNFLGNSNSLVGLLRETSAIVNTKHWPSTGRTHGENSNCVLLYSFFHDFTLDTFRTVSFIFIIICSFQNSFMQRMSFDNVLLNFLSLTTCVIILFFISLFVSHLSWDGPKGPFQYPWWLPSPGTADTLSNICWII